MKSRQILKDLTSNNLTRLSGEGLKALPALNFHVGLPDKGKIGSAFKFIRNIFGSNNTATEAMGMLATGLIAHLIGFENPKLNKAANQGVHGPDFILRQETYKQVWAIFEAKGGTSKHGSSTLGGTGKVKQMGSKWLEHWIRRTANNNDYSEDGPAFIEAAVRPGGPILTAIVSLNFKRPGKEFHIGAQPFFAPNGPLKAWKGF